MKPQPAIPEDFLNGAAEDGKGKPAPPRTRKAKAAKPAPAPPVAPAAPVTPELRRNVVFALVLKDIEALRERAYQDTKKQGRRVTQQSLVDAALRAFLYSKQ